MGTSLSDGSSEKSRKAQLAEDRKVTRALQSRYDSWVTRHPTAAQDFVDAIKEILSEAGLAFDNVTARVKSFRSLRIKALRRDAEGNYIYPNPWEDVHDIIGVRVTTYHSTEIPEIMDALGDSLTVVRTIDKTAETRISGRLGYGSQHLICKVSPTGPAELAPYVGMQFEVQLRTVLQHAWAEFEHDIRYKAPEGATDPRIDRAFALAAGLIELADQQFDQVVAVLEESTPDDSAAHTKDAEFPERSNADDIVLTEETLPGVLTMLLPDSPRSKSEHYDWAEELLELNGITTVGQLRELLSPQRLKAVNKAMKYRFNPGHVRVIDDLLLAARGQQHIDATAATGHNPQRRPPRLRARLEQMADAGVLEAPVPKPGGKKSKKAKNDAREDDRADGAPSS
ncbi:MAG: GTP pyrophosphokinase family protein [Corynebacterium sp.]|uniref:GTP pyrophosphokinase n=1 Tax=Corynebacterium sp. TaxID=1720 RepID=UPI0026DC1DDA|nr:GTP pyrophosphokinase family protein [Corynebacterium sp.]MDO5029596.1 GTP pyrophosphokinase family protein [Corynebacterium sp.]